MHTARLALLLSIGFSACASGDDPPPSAADAWRVASSTDSSETVVAALLARDAVVRDDGAFPPSLYLRCAGGGPAVYVVWRTELAGDTVAVRYALGDGPDQTEQWAASSDRSAAGRWTDSLATPLIRAMTAHDRMRVSVETVDGVQDGAFPLDGLDEALDPLREACGIAEPRP